ncbi:MAG: HU family DNA-binding protein [Planctomycetota bacterium]
MQPKGSKRNIRKKELVNAVAQNTGMTQAYTMQVIERFMAEMIAELARGNRLEFRDFGVFEPVLRKEKKARNPRSGQAFIVPPHMAVRFKMGREMKAFMNKQP